MSTAQGRRKIRSRDRVKILYDILCSVISQQESFGVARITRVQNEVNMPSDRFRQYIDEMERLGLMEHKSTLILTEKGRSFASEYSKVGSLLKRFGLD